MSSGAHPAMTKITTNHLKNVTLSYMAARLVFVHSWSKFVVVWV